MLFLSTKNIKSTETFIYVHALTISTGLPPECLYDRQKIVLGKTWNPDPVNRPCQNCTCGFFGKPTPEVKCIDQTCPYVECPPGEELVVLVGVCCPSCAREYKLKDIFSVLRMSVTVIFLNQVFDRFILRPHRMNIEHFSQLTPTFFVFNMEDTGALRTLVIYFKNCNTPSLGLLDLKVVLVTMLIEWE